MSNIWVPRSPVSYPGVDYDFHIPPPNLHIPFYDLGLGVASLVPFISYGTVGTFSRASTAWTRLQSGLWTQVPANIPRSYYGAERGTIFSGRYDGILIEPANTNVILWSRDLTNAVWTKTNCTAVKDQTGIDGVANSASRVTANANGAIVSQATASGGGVGTCFLKRLSGAGTIEISTDGIIYTDVTSELAAALTDWTSNPVYANATTTRGLFIRFGTNGDSIGVDMVGSEDSIYRVRSPNPTTAAAVTRAADSISFSNVNIINPSLYTIAVTVSGLDSNNPNLYPWTSVIDVNNSTIIYVGTIAKEIGHQLRVGGVLTRSVGAYASVSDCYQFYIAGTNGIRGINAYSNDGVGTAIPSYPNNIGPAVFGTDFKIGVSAFNQQFYGTCVKNLRVWNAELDGPAIATIYS